MERGKSGSMSWTKPEAFSTSTGRACLVVRPAGMEISSLPILYLLHGQFSSEADWWSPKGQLGELLAAINPSPMLIVMPFCGSHNKNLQGRPAEPKLDAFLDDFDKIRTEILTQLNSKPPREAILGISMGGKQALSIVLKSQGVFSALGVLSAKLQGQNYDELKNTLRDRKVQYPQDLEKQLALYYHYCGQHEDVIEKDKRRSGDKKFYDNNNVVCSELGGTLRTRQDGMHNWNYWRPEMAEFIKRLSEVFT